MSTSEHILMLNSGRLVLGYGYGRCAKCVRLFPCRLSGFFVLFLRDGEDFFLLDSEHSSLIEVVNLVPYFTVR